MTCSVSAKDPSTVDGCLRRYGDGAAHGRASGTDLRRTFVLRVRASARTRTRGQAGAVSDWT
ncbi:hypothetical protein FM103_06980 [Corynebacterium xerosis]|nr:hypothetical protein FM103_06980 [Corynebacterium xerosis]